MSTWLAIFLTTIILAAAGKITFLFGRRRKDLPPGPFAIPFFGNPIWLWTPVTELETVMRRQIARYGPFINIRMGPCQMVWIGDHAVAHRALVQNGLTFADRPDPRPVWKSINRDLQLISAATYGATWRLLRRNLNQEMLQSHRVRAHSISRRWALSLLIADLSSHTSVRLIDHLHHTLLRLLTVMCFGKRLPENKIKEIDDVIRGLIIGFRTFDKMYFLPKWVAKILLRNSIKKQSMALDRSNRVFIPLIRERIKNKETGSNDTYVDTLVDLHLPEENRKLVEEEMMSLCSEFLIAGTDTTITELQWIMANLVKNPDYQEKVYQEIIGVVGKAPPLPVGDSLERVVEEDDLKKMPYLKAVVLEGLRRHPPGQFVLNHQVKEDVGLDGYTIPKDTIVNLSVADMGWDRKIWENPMEFKPERFLTEDGEAFDITGNKEIKMMPFGAGRRICPGMDLALLHLGYFVANLVWYYEWRPMEGEGVDLTDAVEFTVVMKHPLRARISRRT